MTEPLEARLLTALSDPTRLRILRQLADCGAVCVCDIVAGCDLTQPTISHHLRVLREAGWVSAERRGTWVWYSIRPEAARALRALAESLVPAGATEPTRTRLPVVQPGAAGPAN